MTGPPEVAHGPRRALNLALAGVTFALAVLGVALPMLPATPFLLLTSYFLLRSSPRLHERLLRSRVFGPLLRDWATHHGVRPHVKVAAIATVGVAVGASFAFADLSTAGRVALVLLAVTGIVVVLRLRVVRENGPSGP